VVQAIKDGAVPIEAVLKRVCFELYLIQTRFLAFFLEIQGYRTYHGVVLQDTDGGGVIIFGKPHTGKTYLARQLIADQNYKLVGDDIIALSIKQNLLYAKPINNFLLAAKQGRNLLFSFTSPNTRSKTPVKIKRIYTLDSYENRLEYLKSKVYLNKRLKKLGLSKLLIKKHSPVLMKLLETEIESISRE